MKVHVKAILRKIRVQNRTQAAIWGMNNGSLVRPMNDVANTSEQFPDSAPDCFRDQADRGISATRVAQSTHKSRGSSQYGPPDTQRNGAARQIGRATVRTLASPVSRAELHRSCRLGLSQSHATLSRTGSRPAALQPSRFGAIWIDFPVVRSTDFTASTPSNPSSIDT